MNKCMSRCVSVRRWGGGGEVEGRWDEGVEGRWGGGVEGEENDVIIMWC